MSELEQRRETFWDFFDFSEGKGLEVGPLDRAIVAPGSADVRYLDVWDQEGVRAHYAGDPGVDPELIPVIDFYLTQPDGRTLSLAEAAHGGGPFDWVMASHVIEHVPDVIGWLGDLAELVVDGGALVLAIPDKRFCFDVLRPTTTIGQMLAARDAGDVTPSIRAVYDHFSSALDFDAAALWRGDPPDPAARRHTVEQADDLARRSLTGEYIDAHVWLFTPDVLIQQMRELRRIGRSDWYVTDVRPTPVNTFEFLVTMRRIDRGSEGSYDVAGELAPSNELPDWLEGQALARMVGDRERRVAKLEQRLAQKNKKIAALRKRLAAERSREPGNSSRALDVAARISRRAASLRRRKRG